MKKTTIKSISVMGKGGKGGGGGGRGGGGKGGGKGGRGGGRGGWPSTVPGRPSGGGRTNNPPKK